MDEYISVQSVIKTVLSLFITEDEKLLIINRLKSIPAADVRPVAKAKWETDDAGAAICTACGEYVFETSTHHLCGWFPNFCPNCGADMRQKPLKEKEPHSCWTCEYCGDGEEINDYGYCWLHNGEDDNGNEFTVIDRQKGCDEWTPKVEG